MDCNVRCMLNDGGEARFASAKPFLDALLRSRVRHKRQLRIWFPDQVTSFDHPGKGEVEGEPQKGYKGLPTLCHALPTDIQRWNGVNYSSGCHFHLRWSARKRCGLIARQTSFSVGCPRSEPDWPHIKSVSECYGFRCGNRPYRGRRGGRRRDTLALPPISIR